MVNILVKEIAIIVLKALGSSLASVLNSAFSALGEFIKYLNFLKEEKKDEKEEEKKEKQKQEIKEYNEKVKDACDNGTVEDLINL